MKVPEVKHCYLPDLATLAYSCIVDMLNSGMVLSMLMGFTAFVIRIDSCRESNLLLLYPLSFRILAAQDVYVDRNRNTNTDFREGSSGNMLFNFNAVGVPVNVSDGQESLSLTSRIEKSRPIY
ncbi:hypothetical protein BGZ99_006704 [Dissophora globulifera]|uniref:Uncharacterized protein n=1 Tax=Dissophora globulifera TaxID=979702 RepID=A0A9P6RE39_9FUNG|nr:hypothetical protein BGZ99_006704 [Dissophora globulifera]